MTAIGIVMVRVMVVRLIGVLWLELTRNYLEFQGVLLYPFVFAAERRSILIRLSYNEKETQLSRTILISIISPTKPLQARVQGLTTDKEKRHVLCFRDLAARRNDAVLD